MRLILLKLMLFTFLFNTNCYSNQKELYDFLKLVDSPVLNTFDNSDNILSDYTHKVEYDVPLV